MPRVTRRHRSPFCHAVQTDAACNVSVATQDKGCAGEAAANMANGLEVSGGGLLGLLIPAGVVLLLHAVGGHA